MRRSVILALAMASATLGTIPLAQAQPMGPQAMGRDRGPGPGRFVPKPQTAQLHAKLQAIDNDVMNAAKSRRISYPQSRDLHHQLSVLEQRLYGQARHGLTSEEFDSIDQGASRVRQQLSNTPAYAGPRRH